MNQKNDLLTYRRKRAQGSLQDAKILFRENSLYSAVNRIYYSLFYEVSALLATLDLASAKHSGVRAIFNEQFVKTGKVSIETGKFYSVMFDFRQKSDYGDFVQFEHAKVQEWIAKAEECIRELEGVLEIELKKLDG
jgi:uncharacterized protein (UPF0332 family)